jgi:hypothetical protein
VVRSDLHQVWSWQLTAAIIGLPPAGLVQTFPQQACDRSKLGWSIEHHVCIGYHSHQSYQPLPSILPSHRNNILNLNMQHI